MKKISRRSFITAMAAVSAAGVLAACGSSSSTCNDKRSCHMTGPGSLYYEFCFFCGFFRCIQRSNFLCRIYG